MVAETIDNLACILRESVVTTVARVEAEVVKRVTRVGVLAGEVVAVVRAGAGRVARRVFGQADAAGATVAGEVRATILEDAIVVDVVVDGAALGLAERVAVEAAVFVTGQGGASEEGGSQEKSTDCLDHGD